MKNLSIYFTAFALLAGAVSCDLTEAPQAKAGRDMIFGSETGLKNYTYGFYNYLPNYDDAFKLNTTMDNAAKNATGTYELGVGAPSETSTTSSNTTQTHVSPKVSETTIQESHGCSGLTFTIANWFSMAPFHGLPCLLNRTARNCTMDKTAET